MPLGERLNLVRGTPDHFEWLPRVCGWGRTMMGDQQGLQPPTALCQGPLRGSQITPPKGPQLFCSDLLG